MFMGIDHLKELPREALEGMLEDSAKNWLTHDGLWFLAVEQAFGLEAAIEADMSAWERFTVIEAMRIMQRHGIPTGGGLEALKAALHYRLYAMINEQDIIDETEDSFVFTMVDCRVQSARGRKGLERFPCKRVGLVEYSGFARTIDSRIKTECVACPPDETPRGFYCAWRFSL
jgi:hypothetical protein